MPLTFVTEEQMQGFMYQHFTNQLPDGWVCREQCSSARGIADIVLGRLDMNSLGRRRESGIPAILDYALCRIVTVLISHGPMTPDDLAGHTGYTRRYFRRVVMGRLDQYQIAAEVGGLVVPNARFESPVKEIEAVELKLRDWRRAQNQAAGYRNFAERSDVVLALDGAICDRNHKSLSTSPLGLMFASQAAVVTAQEASTSPPPSEVDRLFVSEQLIESLVEDLHPSVKVVGADIPAK